MDNLTNPLTIQTETITPAQAAILLARNTNNRPLNKNHVKFLADQMRSGKWQQAGDPIRLSNTDRLLDGQHRLTALIEADVTLDLVIIRDLPEETFHVMDTGRLRRAGDVLAAGGISQATTVASAARLLVNYRRGMYKLNNQRGQIGTVTNSDIVAFLAEHDLTEAIHQSKKWYNQCRLFTQSEYAFLFYVFNAIDTEAALDFLIHFSSGANLTEDSPILLLRRKIENYKINKLALSGKERLALTIKAWNLYRAGKTVSLLTWNQDKHEFPSPK